MTRNTSSRVLSAAFAAVFCAVLSACSGGSGTSTLPQSPAQHQQQPAPQAPAGSATTESTVVDNGSAVVDNGSAEPMFSYSNFVYHIMPPYKTSAQTKIPATTVYNQDLQYFGGELAGQLVYHNVYLDCKTSCWGNPWQFLKDLGGSSMLHLIDQYETAPASLVPGTSFAETHRLYGSVLSQGDLIRYLHRAIYMLGGKKVLGPNHIFNLFLPPGVDTCFDTTSSCYSPDNPASMAFCAYHSAVTFSDWGTVFFTVEPYQGTPYCGYGNLIPDLNSATGNVLSHETFEAMTDPLPGSGWLGNYGEIGDECAWTTLTPETFNGRTYTMQLEYSNAVHACSDQATSVASLPKK